MKIMYVVKFLFFFPYCNIYITEKKRYRNLSFFKYCVALIFMSYVANSICGRTVILNTQCKARHLLLMSVCAATRF